MGGMGMRMERMRYLATRTTMSEQEKTAGGGAAVPLKKAFVRGGEAI